MIVRIDTNAFDIARIMRQHPRWIARARRSALASVGYKLKKKIEEQYKTGRGWSKPKKPGKHGMAWWAKFVRYRITPRKLLIFPSKSRVGDKKPIVDRGLMQIIKKHEYGKKIRVTPKLRRYMAAIGYPLRKTTRYLHIPQRSAYLKVFDENEQSIPNWFEKKFFDNLRRYESGLSKDEWQAVKNIPGFVSRIQNTWKLAA